MKQIVLSLEFIDELEELFDILVYRIQEECPYYLVHPV